MMQREQEYIGKKLRRPRGVNAAWRLVCFFVVLIFTASLLSGCAIRGTTDKEFLGDMAEGLEARWDLSEKYKDEDSKEIWEKLIDSEYDKIDKYRDADFRDEKLGKLAYQYIGLIEESKKCLKFYDDDDRFAYRMNEIYNKRAAIVYRLVKSENLMVDDKYRSNVEMMTKDGRTYIAASRMIKKIHFKVSRRRSGSVTYEATVTNRAHADFKYFDLYIALVDKDGNVVKWEVPSTENWRSQTKHRFRFTTDADFDRMEIRECDYERSK